MQTFSEELLTESAENTEIELMTVTEFKSKLEKSSPPKDLPYHLEALWYDGVGNWNKSHEVVQDVNGKDAAWIHAYLHRKEGDIGNAQYWYSRAGKSMPSVSLDEEWASLVEYFLKN